jgi:MraZ protein
MRQLPFDSAGRIVLPEGLCEEMGITDWVALVGLGDRFQIWSLDAYKAHRETQRQAAREGLANLRMAQRSAKTGTA